MTPAELPGYLRIIRARVAFAAPAVANATAREYRHQVADVTLRKSGSHPRGTKTPARPGAPPARESGNLADSVRQTVEASTPVVARSRVSALIFYAPVQEFGHRMHAHKRYMVFFYGEPYKARTVTVPPRPYFFPTTVRMIVDGQFTAIAVRTFEEFVWGAG